MRRFDDVLRMVSSILLGTMIREFDEMCKRLQDYYTVGTGTKSEWMPKLAVLLLLALFFRNIHVSYRYDQYLEESGCRVTFESTISGRFLTWLFSVIALFGGPSYSGHFLAHGLDSSTAPIRLAITLALTLIIYLLWDIILWWDPATFTTSTGRRDLWLDDVVVKWMRLEVAAVTGIIWLVIARVFFHSRAQVNLGVDVVRIFVFTTSFVIVGDYYWNRVFYFGSSRSDPESRVEPTAAPDAAPASGGFPATSEGGTE